MTGYTMKKHIACVRASLGLGLALLLPLSGCAVDGGLDEAAQPILPADDDRVTEGALRPSADLAGLSAVEMERLGVGDFDLEAFRAAIDAAASRTAASAAPLYSSKVITEAFAEVLVGATVARAARVGRDEVVPRGRLACGAPGQDECPKRFVAAVSQHDDHFAQAIAQIVSGLHGRVSGVHVTVWKVSRGGVEEPGAITLHGLVRGRLIGVVYYL